MTSKTILVVAGAALAVPVAVAIIDAIIAEVLVKVSINLFANQDEVDLAPLDSVYESPASLG